MISEIEVPGWLNWLIYFGAGFGATLNIIITIAYYVQGNYFNFWVFFFLTAVGIVAVCAYHFRPMRRFVWANFLIFIAAVIALISVNHEEVINKLASIFGISAFIWLVFEKLFKD